MRPTRDEERHIQCVEWAISLSQANLDDFSDGDWLKLKEELHSFIFGGEEGSTPFFEGVEGRTLGSPRVVSRDLKRDALVRNVSQEDLRQIRDGLEEWLEKQADLGLGFYPVFARGTNFAFGTYAADQTFTWMILPRNFTVAAMFAFGMHLVGSQITGEQIRDCPLCGRCFLLKRKPRADRNFYCTPRCATNAATKAYRERQKTENAAALREKERGRSRERYVKRQKQKHGPKVKVERRPRKP